jgi:hypothetical protein
LSGSNTRGGDFVELVMLTHLFRVGLAQFFFGVGLSGSPVGCWAFTVFLFERRKRN